MSFQQIKLDRSFILCHRQREDELVRCSSNMRQHRWRFSRVYVSNQEHCCSCCCCWSFSVWDCFPNSTVFQAKQMMNGSISLPNCKKRTTATCIGSELKVKLYRALVMPALLLSGINNLSCEGKFIADAAVFTKKVTFFPSGGPNGWRWITNEPIKASPMGKTNTAQYCLMWAFYSLI